MISHNVIPLFPGEIYFVKSFDCYGRLVSVENSLYKMDLHFVNIIKSMEDQKNFEII